MFQSYKNAETILAIQSTPQKSTRKNRIVYCDSDGKVWSGYASRPKPDNIAGSTLQLPSLQQEQLPDWAYDSQVAYETYNCASQQTQDPAPQHTQASAEPPAEKKKMTRKHCRSAAPKPERKQRRSTPARKKRALHTAAAATGGPQWTCWNNLPKFC
jgi:hypothetical protein